MPKVIAETDELLVLDKPSGLIVHSDGRTQEPSLADWILEQYPELADIGGAWVSPKPAQGLMPGAKRLGISPQGERVPLRGIVHRLDRTTSGVILVAKTVEAFAYLKNEFKERRVEKTYRAFVYGNMESEEGKIVAEIMRSKEPPKRWYARACEESDNRAAVTEWKLLKQLEEAAYLEVRPRTGRTHQIRVHLASIGHPIVADHLYSGKESILGMKRPALHAYRISVMLRGKQETFTAPLPTDFRF